MIYIYDILLNWNQNKLYDFFEWEKTDKLEHIKKIPLIKIDKGIIKDFLYYKIKVDENIINKIYNMTESYTAKKTNKIPYAFLITDGTMALAVKTDKNGNVTYRSRLIIDEEEEVLILSSKIKTLSFKYEVKEKIDNINFLTRKEEKIKKYLTNEIEKSYKNKNYEKLKYLYTEYFNLNSNDISNIYKSLINSFEQEINEKHYNLYNLLQLIGNKN